MNEPTIEDVIAEMARSSYGDLPKWTNQLRAIAAKHEKEREVLKRIADFDCEQLKLMSDGEVDGLWKTHDCGHGRCITTKLAAMSVVIAPNGHMSIWDINDGQVVLMFPSPEIAITVAETIIRGLRDELEVPS